MNFWQQKIKEAIQKDNYSEYDDSLNLLEVADEMAEHIRALENGDYKKIMEAPAKTIRRAIEVRLKAYSFNKGSLVYKELKDLMNTINRMIDE